MLSCASASAPCADLAFACSPPEPATAEPATWSAGAADGSDEALGASPNAAAKSLSMISMSSDVGREDDEGGGKQGGAREERGA